MLGQGVRLVGGETQLQQGDGGDVETRAAGAAIDQHRDARDCAAGLADEFDAFVHASAAGHDVLHDQHGLPGCEREAAPQDEDVVFLFGKDVADLGPPGDFLPDHESAHRGGEDGLELEALGAHFLEQELGQALHCIHALAHLSALKVVAAVQAGAQHEVPFEQSAGADKNIEDFLLTRVHPGTLWHAWQKTKSILRAGRRVAYSPVALSHTTTLLLEDELGDVLDKAMRREGMTPDRLAAIAGVSLARICDTIDYRGDLTCDELRRLAGILGLNEVGLCALGSNRYPLPEIGALPFCVWPLRMPHGIGVANAYLIGECGAARAILFDTGGGIEELSAVWPASVRELDAVFLTHVEPEHAGGLCEVVKRFGVPEAFVPEGAAAPCGRGLGEGECRHFGRIKVTAFATPGHAAAHNCYLVSSTVTPHATSVLISGDLVFAGSVGGAYFSHEQLRSSLRRMLAAVPSETVIAPGHGPITTVENELRYNPFVV